MLLLPAALAEVTATVAAATTAATTAKFAAWAFFAWASFVHNNVTTTKVAIVESFNSCFCFIIVTHFNEAEAT